MSSTMMSTMCWKFWRNPRLGTFDNRKKADQCCLRTKNERGDIEIWKLGWTFWWFYYFGPSRHVKFDPYVLATVFEDGDYWWMVSPCALHDFLYIRFRKIVYWVLIPVSVKHEIHWDYYPALDTVSRLFLFSRICDDELKNVNSWPYWFRAQDYLSILSILSFFLRYKSSQ